MSILIKGIKMPDNCYDCPLNYDYIDCMARNEETERVRVFLLNNERSPNCPLIELPDHGDLIDRDALMAKYAEEVKPSNNSDFMRPPRWNDAVQLTELAPAVIPAERSEE